MLKGIDVSYAQGNFNWKAVNREEVQFAMLRAGYGWAVSQKDMQNFRQKDKQFEDNYRGCKENGIPCGVYWYSYAETAEHARLEAETCLEVIKDKIFEYPIVFDIEEERSKINASDICTAFCKTIEKAGYYVSIYGSVSYLTSFISNDILKKYDVWVAHYGVEKPGYQGKYGMWQYSCNGRVSGCAGDVDLDYSYKNYPEIINKGGLNGFVSKTFFRRFVNFNIYLLLIYAT